MIVSDAHHHGSFIPTAVNNIRLGVDEIPDADVPLSIGLHPWDSAVCADMLSGLEDLASDRRVVAVGETGLDALRGAPLEQQLELFREHVRISEMLSKPLIIHSVRTLHLILGLHRSLKPEQPWAIHGFRGNPQQLCQLHSAGIYTSVGTRIPRSVMDHENVRGFDSRLMLVETDTSENLPSLPFDTAANLARFLGKRCL